MKFLDSRRRKIPFKRLLRLIERDLVQSLNDKIEELPAGKKEEEPYRTWLAKARERLGRIEKDR